MRAFFLILALLCPLVQAQRLVLVGGGSYPPGALKSMVEWGGQEKANILVIPWATDDANYAFDRFQKAILPYHPLQVENAGSRETLLQNKVLFLKQLKNATGVFFTGGDQVLIMKTAAQDPEILKAIRDKFLSGTVFGGSSAGTAVMPRIMYTGEGDFTVIDPNKVEMVPGFDFCPGILLDQHFLKRQRQNRLTSVLLRGEEKIGIGVDENNAVTLEDNRLLRVVGQGQALVLERKNDKVFQMVLLSEGDSYQLP